MVNALVEAVKRRLAASHPEFVSVRSGRVNIRISDEMFVEHAARALEQGSPGPLSAFESTIPPERQLQILRRLIEHRMGADAWRKQHQHQREARHLTLEDLAKPQWATVAKATAVRIRLLTSDTDGRIRWLQRIERAGFTHHERAEGGETIVEVMGHRAVLAFFKVQCPFVCEYCTLPGANDGLARFRDVGEPSPATQLLAYQRAMQITEEKVPLAPQVEILCDGSWFSDRELSDETRELILDDLRRRDHVLTVAVESRPEYVTATVVARDMQRLGDGKILKLYFGLETVDDFIASCARKLYGWDEFETAVRAMLELSEELRRRLVISAYNIIKQGFMTERESLEQALEVARRVDSLRRATGLALEVKHEPTVIAKGTLQHYFFHQRDASGRRLYRNQSYYTIAELFVRLHAEGLAARSNLGQRDDIDDIDQVAMIAQPQDELAYSNLDFIVYDATQEFAAHGDFERFCEDLLPAVLTTDGAPTPEFAAWEAWVYPGESSAIRTQIERVLTNGLSAQAPARIALRHGIWSLCEELGRDPGLRELARDPAAAAQAKAAIAGRFDALGERLGFAFVRVNNLLTREPDDSESGLLCEAVLRIGREPSSVWFVIG